MINFDWTGFTQDTYERYQKDNDERLEDCIGCIRCGDICFDIVVRYIWENPLDTENDNTLKRFLDYDCYEGGVDDGYGYSNKNGYPYTERGGGSFSTESTLLPWEDFKYCAEAALWKFLKDNNLIDKAEQPLNIW